MAKFKDLTGLKFNRLTVIELHHKKEVFRKDRQCVEYKYYWLCKCDCGNFTIVEGNPLKLNKTKSCGCLQKENIKEVVKKYCIKHGKKDTRLYKIWQGMKARCYIKNTDNYCYYGGRGISVCNEWKNNFINFYNWAINNGYSDKLSIDRINVNGNYEPNNCRWVDWKTQMNNTTLTYYIEYKGQKKTLSEWSDIVKISANTIFARLNILNWSIEKSLTTPIRKLSKSKKVKCIETNKIYMSTKDAEKKTGILMRSISNCCNKRQKSTNGYHFEYVE